MTLINIIILIGAIQGFFLSFLFLLKKNIHFHQLFSLILLTISIAFLIAYLQNVLDYQTYPFMIKTSLPLPLIFIPGLLVYLKKLTGSYRNNRITNYLLFAPLFLIILFNIPFYLGSNAIKIEYFIRNDLNGNPLLIESLEDIFVELMVTLFSFIAVLEANIYRRRIKQIYSNMSEARCGWIQFLAYSMLTLTLFALILSVGRLFSDKVPIGLNFITAIGSTIAVYYIAYYLLVHPDALSEVSEAIKSIDERNEKSKETGKETSKEPKDSLFPEYEIKIIRCLENDKLYLNPDLTLAELAAKIGIPAYLTSKVISQNMKTNFYSLINKYRLQQVKQELLMETGRNIIEIAYQSGFNSKTTFYESFRKDTGVSPSEFVEDNKSESISR